MGDGEKALCRLDGVAVPIVFWARAWEAGGAWMVWVGGSGE